ncbi:hypothetical protein [Pseudomonas sp. PB3P13]
MDKDSVFMVAGNLVSVSAGISPQWGEDVLNSLLFAGLYANSQVDRFYSAQQWSKENDTAMEQLKWNLSSSTSYNFLPDAKDGFVLKDSVMHQLNAALGAVHSAQMGRLLDSLQVPTVAEALAAETEEHALFRLSKVNTQKVATFFLRCSLVEPGPAVSNVSVFFKTTEDIGNGFLSQQFKSAFILGEVIMQVSRRVLDKKAYERKDLRKTVKEMLPSDRDHLICDLSSR